MAQSVKLIVGQRIRELREKKGWSQEKLVDIGGLVDEYRVLLGSRDRLDSAEAEKLLVSGADWTPLAARRLVRLARNYGSFMLRNAAAVAIALGIEDGDLGF